MNDLSWVAALIGAPWKLRGRDPVSGWDCLGCAEVCQARMLGTPEINSLRFYAGETGKRPSAMMAEHFDAAVSLYRRAPERTPGAIILFRNGGRPVHCGLYLGHGRFLHASRAADTVISLLTDGDYARSASDFFLPARYSGNGC